MTDYDEQLPAVAALAERAGAAILEIYDSDFDVERKDDDSPLTAADTAAHEIIVAGLKELTPDLPLLSEEGGQPAFSTRRQWQRYWLVDPLDGTKEFVKRNGQFTVNIALIENGRPVLGAVHAPVLEATWTATVAGAHKRSNSGEQQLQVTPADATCPRVLVSRSHRGTEIDALLARLPDYRPVTMGSSLKFCTIAEGRADLYPRLGPTSEWDTGAGHAVLLGAGGRVINTAGAELSYNRKESILNPYFLAFGDDRHDWRQYLTD